MKIGPAIPLQILRVSDPVADKGSGGKWAAGGDLKVGQLLKATVIGTSDDGLMQLKTEGRIISARSQVPFLPGTEVLLEVHQEGNPPLLSVAAREMAVADLVKYLFANNGRMSAALAALRPVLSGAATAEELPGGAAGALLKELWPLLADSALNSSSDPGKILAMIKALSSGRSASGVGSESGLSGLQELLESFSGDVLKHRGGREELNGLFRLGQFLEIVKSVNLQTSGSGQPDFSIFPCFFSSAEGWGHWMFSAAREEGGAPDRDYLYSLDFFLDMSRLGEIHLSIQAGPGVIRGSFQVEKKDVSEFLNSKLGELQKVLSGYGYSNVVLGCRQSNREFRQIFKETVEQKGRFGKVALVNVQV